MTPRPKLLVNAWIFRRVIRATHRGKTYEFKRLDEARSFARKNGYTGIQVKFH